MVGGLNSFMNDSKKVLKICGKCLMALSIIYVIKSFSQIDLASMNLGRIDRFIFILLILSFLPLINICIVGLAWKKHVDFISKENNDTRTVICIYLKSNIAKYLPGNVGHYVGRNVIGAKLGISQKCLAIASIIEAVFIFVSTVIFCAFVSFSDLIKVVQKIGDFIIVKKHLVQYIVIMLIVVTGVILAIKKFLAKYIKDYFGKGLAILFGKTFLLYTIGNFFSGILLALIFGLILNQKINYKVIISTNALSWLIGFIVPGSPGGIGIRESVLVFFLQHLYGKEDVVIAAMLMRICSIVGDFGAYLLSVVVEHHYKRRENRNALT